MAVDTGGSNRRFLLTMSNASTSRLSAKVLGYSDIHILSSIPEVVPRRGLGSPRIYSRTPHHYLEQEDVTSRRPMFGQHLCGDPSPRLSGVMMTHPEGCGLESKSGSGSSSNGWFLRRSISLASELISRAGLSNRCS